MRRSDLPASGKDALPLKPCKGPTSRRDRKRKCETTSRVKPPCIGLSSQPAASICQGRGHLAKPTSIAMRRGVPISPLSIQRRIVATAGDEAKGKFTAPRSAGLGHEGACIGDIDRQRLLAEHALAGRQRRAGVRRDARPGGEAM